MLNLVVGFHCHIPWGIDDAEFEKMYAQSLKPFISVLYRYPHIPVTIHYSGVLLQWIERSHPEFFTLLRDMVALKQVELLGGGFYEPALSVLPPIDRVGQIELFTTYLRKKFGKRPQGCKLPLLDWEQNIVGTLNACGMSYTFLDESYWIAAGSAIRPCITEDQGKLIMVFPIASHLHKAFTRQSVSEVLNTIQTVPDSIVTIFPDRFAIESGTESAEQSFCRFFDGLSQFIAENAAVEVSVPSKFYKTLHNLPKVYFNGSIPKQCLTVAPESSCLYAKMMFTHTLINQLRGDKSRKRTAREELWKAQGYDSFFPGSAYYHLTRASAYKALVYAEKITREKRDTIPALLSFDFDMDGTEEYLFQAKQCNYYVSCTGAGIFEWDYIPRAWNYRGARQYALADRLVPPCWTDAEPFVGRFCGSEHYQPVTIDKGHATVVLRLPATTGVFGSIEIEKAYHLEKDVLTIRYTLTNRSEVPETGALVPGIDLSFPDTRPDMLQIYCTKDGIKEAINPEIAAPCIEFQDFKNDVCIRFLSDRYFTATLRPPAYLLLFFPFSLGAGARFETTVSIITAGLAPSHA